MIYKEPKVYYTSSRSKLNVIKKNLENVYRKLSMTNSLIFTRLLKLDTLEDENVILSKISKSTKKIKVEAY